MGVFRLDKEIKSLIGKTLIDVKYGFCKDAEEADEIGERYMPLPAKITDAWVSGGHKEVKVVFMFEGHEEDPDNFYVYDSEAVTFK